MPSALRQQRGSLQWEYHTPIWDLQTWSPEKIHTPHQSRADTSRMSSLVLYSYVPIPGILAQSQRHLYVSTTIVVEAPKRTDCLRALTLGDLDWGSRSLHFAGGHRSEVCGWWGCDRFLTIGFHMHVGPFMTTSSPREGQHSPRDSGGGQVATTSTQT